ncbi:MAG: crossover junction endodeoxyribonuclease RuvC [Clostridia bacterium]|nr:crossover junction endodeoxyribonuclease RuvC [Clostridia bacterium]
MRILGIDPGYAIVGWGVLDYEQSRFRVVDFGALRTSAKTDTNTRLELIYRGIGQIIETYAPTHMGIEELFFNTNQTTAIVVAEARGVILLSAKQHGLTVGEYTPLQVKQSVVGYGRAEKQQVIRMVTTMLGLPKPPKPDDTADALAIAICHAHSDSSRIRDYFNR